MINTLNANFREMRYNNIRFNLIFFFNCKIYNFVYNLFSKIAKDNQPSNNSNIGSLVNIKFNINLIFILII